MIEIASPSLIAERLDAVRERIVAAGGDLEVVRILAVTKGFGPDAVRHASEVGLFRFGENYADELVKKARELEADESFDADIEWHFIGHIQRNKLARLSPFTARYGGVTRIEEGRDLARRNPGARLLVEVDTTGLANRPGVAVADVAALVEELRALELSVEGLMTVAPPGGGEAAEACFQQVSALARSLELSECSMGMSADFELAVRAGSTEVRIGTAFFGPRATRV